MLFIYGTRGYKIRKIPAQNVICNVCGNPFHDVYVYREVFHLFFIPLIPLATRYVENVCTNCNYRSDSYNNEYLSRARTSPIFYWLFFAIPLIVAFLIVLNFRTQKEKAIFVQDPKIKDVYLIRDDTKGAKKYYFFKVVNVREDSGSVEVIHSAYQYNSFTTKMDNKDYFVKDDVLRFSKNDLSRMLKEGYINSVERDYGAESRFHAEK